MGTLVEPFAPEYMQRAWLELALLAVPAGTLGVFVALRRLSFAAHALGIGAFPGAVLAYGLGVSAFAGGLVAALVFALLLALLQRRRELDASAATGLLLAGALALGSVLVSDVFTASARVDTLLFGSLLGVTNGDLLLTGAIAAVTLVLAAALGRGWLVVAFDRRQAPALGFQPGRLDALLFALLAVTVVASVGAVGSLLASTLFVVPAATVRMLTRRMATFATGSAALALALATAGLWLSFHTDAPPGATVAALAAAVFVVTFALTSLRGFVLRRGILAAAGAAGVLLLAGCGAADERAGGEPDKLQVVATTPLVADWARTVGERAVTVTTLLGTGVDPHDYEPGPTQVEAVEDSDVVVALGAGFDGFAEAIVESAGGSAELVELAPASRLVAPALEGRRSDLDPHYWHDPTLAAAAIRMLAAALAAAEPGSAGAFERNAGAYVERLEALDLDLRRRYRAVPSARRKLVTDHDALGYLARRYGISVVGAAIPSTSTAAEANAGETAELIETIRRERVRAIFSESSVDPKVVSRLAEETGARVYPDLYGDTLGPAGSGAETYVTMMRHNARLLVDGWRRR